MSDTRPMSAQGDTTQMEATSELPGQPAVENQPTQPAAPPVELAANAEPVAPVPRPARPSHTQILKRLRLGGSYLSEAGRTRRSAADGTALGLPSWRELRENTPLMVVLAAALFAAFLLIFLAIQGSADSKKTAAEIRIEKKKAAHERAAALSGDKNADKHPKKVDAARSDTDSSPQPPVKPTGARPVSSQSSSSTSVVAEPAPSAPASAPPAEPAPAPDPAPAPGDGTTTTPTTTTP
jgi:hypothetical protein